MGLVKCPHCAVETTDRQDNCYYCGRGLYESPSGSGVAPKTSAPLQPHTPTNEAIELGARSYAVWMRRYLLSLGIFALVYGIQAGSIIGLFLGAIVAISLGLLSYIASLLFCMVLSSLFGENEALLPITAIILVGLATAVVAFKGSGKGGSGDCIDSGRYSEHSNCS